MPKTKSKKEYALKLTHPVLGTFYLRRKESISQYTENYYSSGYGWRSGWKYVPIFYFTQDLSKVKKWKKESTVRENIRYIKEDVKKNKKSIIILPLGSSVSHLPEDVQNALTLLRKKYFFYVDEISNSYTATKLQNIQNNALIDIQNKIKNINKTIDDKLFDKKLENDLISLKENISKYSEDEKQLSKLLLVSGITFDVVDASYNFRAFKLKNLQKKTESSQD